jgi:hypothetical protein
MGVLITVAEAKSSLHLGSSDETHLGVLVDGVEEWLARTCSTQFVAGDVLEVHSGGRLSIRPFMVPVISITKITDLLLAQEVSTTLYRFLGDRIYYEIGSDPVVEWPEGTNRYQVEFVAGYNNGNGSGEGEIPAPVGSTAAPAGLKLIALHLVQRAYHVGGGQTSQANQGATISWDSLLGGEIADLLSAYQPRSL